MRCGFHPDALVEYEEAARYYAGCQDGLDLRFMASVRPVVSQIVAAPERWRTLEGGVRRCLAKVFPDAVMYTIEHDRLKQNAEPSGPPNSAPPSR